MNEFLFHKVLIILQSLTACVLLKTFPYLVSSLVNQLCCWN